MKGGYLSEDLVDGTLCLYLKESVLANAELGRMKALWEQCVSSDLGGIPEVGLDLTGASLEADMPANLDRYVCQLTLKRVEVSDNMIEQIVKTCPALHTLNLDETSITDRALELIARLPVRSLSIRNTSVTSAGIRELRNCTGLYELSVSEDMLSEEELETLQTIMPGCTIHRESRG